MIMQYLYVLVKTLTIHLTDFQIITTLTKVLTTDKHNFYWRMENNQYPTSSIKHVTWPK